MDFLISFLFPMPLMHALPFPTEDGREREREEWCARTRVKVEITLEIYQKQ
jgi:hypothetical protein